jgi:hypothetical protein
MSTRPLSARLGALPHAIGIGESARGGEQRRSGSSGCADSS